MKTEDAALPPPPLLSMSVVRFNTLALEKTNKIQRKLPKNLRRTILIKNTCTNLNYMYNLFLYEVKLIAEDLDVELPETSELGTTLIQYDCDIDLALDAIEKKLLNQ